MIAFRQALSKFPLVTLEQDDPIPSIKTAALAARERDSAVLWVSEIAASPYWDLLTLTSDRSASSERFGT